MTATDELRRLLDERGVEWSATVGASGTIWTHWDAFNGHRVHAMDNEDGTVEIFGEWDVTPEQAIAATLGNEDDYTREDVEGAFVSGYSLGCLPVGSDPTWDQNEQTVDEYMAEWGWVRKESATLGTGTCHLVRERVGKSGKAYRMVCSECHHVIYDGWQEKPRYCAFCGARVEDE